MGPQCDYFNERQGPPISVREPGSPRGPVRLTYFTRVRNPDLLTSLDVLSTGQYTRFPTVHQVRADLACHLSGLAGIHDRAGVSRSHQSFRWNWNSYAS